MKIHLISHEHLKPSTTSFTMASKLKHLSNIFKPPLHQTILKRHYSEGLPENIRKGFENFQRDDGVPVYLKDERGDRILLGITIILLAIGLEESARTFIKLDVRK